MRISDWSSDVCSSDLRVGATVEADAAARGQEAAAPLASATGTTTAAAGSHAALALFGQQLGDVLGAAVVDRDVLGHHLGALLDRDARVGLVLLVLGDLDLRRHPDHVAAAPLRSEEHTSELQSLMRISYAVFCL